MSSSSSAGSIDLEHPDSPHQIRYIYGLCLPMHALTSSVLFSNTNTFLDTSITASSRTTSDLSRFLFTHCTEPRTVLNLRLSLKTSKAESEQSESGKGTTLKRKSICHHSSFCQWAWMGRCFSDVHMPPTMHVFWQVYIHLPSCACSHAYCFAKLQLLRTPNAFQAERIAWRTVIYLNLVHTLHSFHYPCLLLTMSIIGPYRADDLTRG